VTSDTAEQVFGDYRAIASGCSGRSSPESGDWDGRAK